MAKGIQIKLQAQDRLDMPDFNYLQESGFKPKSYEEIMKEMVTTFQASCGQQAEVLPGSILATLFSIMADQLVAVQIQMSSSYPNPPVQQTWIYPDGTRSVNKPRDGQKFTLQCDPYNSDEYTWDDVKSQWFRTGTYVKIPQSIDFIPVHIHVGNLEETKCECGSEKTGSNRHSTWCDKYNPDL